MPREKSHKAKDGHKQKHASYDRNKSSGHQQQQHHHSRAGGGSGVGDGLLGDMLGAAARSAGSAVARRAVAFALSGGQGAAEGAKAGTFDLYLFAQSWAPRFCCSQREKCETQGIQNTNGLSTHGLWPSYQDPKPDGKTFPAFCQKGSKGSGEFDLAEHEWRKHGTCTGLSRDKYVEEEHRIANSLPEPNQDGTPPALKAAAGDALELKIVRESYSNTVGIQLDDKCRLREVTTCFAKFPDGRVGQQVDCPEHVLLGSRNSNPSECSKVYLDKPGTCASISKALLKSLREAA